MNKKGGLTANSAHDAAMKSCVIDFLFIALQ